MSIHNHLTSSNPTPTRWRVKPKYLFLGLAVVALIAILIVVARPKPSSDPAPVEPADESWFDDVTESAGLSFTHDAGVTGEYFLPQVMGSGAALFDGDGDDRLDILLLQNGGPQSASRNQFFQQQADGTFRNRSQDSGLDVAGHGMGTAVGDVNNDGKPDVVITEYRGVRLFLNRGDCRFSEASKTAGLDSLHWGTATSFVDYDRDGWLDLVVVHYIDYDSSQRCSGTSARQDFCHPKTFPGTVTRLFRNLGRQSDGSVKFQDVTLASGLAKQPGPGLGVLCADFDGDGWQDILVANDAAANHLWMNQKNGKFREEAIDRGCALNANGNAEGNMGVVFGDVNGDGLSDLFVTHLSEETNTLWMQRSRGQFVDRTKQVGLASPLKRGTGFGVTLADFDCDGESDLVVVNGRVARSKSATQSGFHWNDYAECNQVFANSGGNFRDVSPANQAFCSTPRVGRALCSGDIWNRGRIDLLATYIAAPARLYRNRSPQFGHWLVVRAFAPEWNRDAVGATVTVQSGSTKWQRTVQPGSSYLSSNDPRVHFGLGAIDQADSIQVAWPDGTAEIFAAGPVDRHLVLKKGTGSVLK